MKIVILDGYAANPGDLSWEEIQQLGECNIYERTKPNEILERARNAEVILTNKTVITAQHIEKMPNLKYIGVMATGYNIVDIDAAKERNIVVTNIPSYSTESVSQMVFAHILNITQRVEYYTNRVKDGEWTRNKDFCFWDTNLMELKDKKIGIIGLGNTGKATARIALGFGMDVYAYTSKSRLQVAHEITIKSLEEIFKECDIISLHCILSEKTKHLINKEHLKLMKPSAILINTGRGALVNEKDLADALNNNVIAAAGVDVLSTEPPKADNPLLTAKNCFITPHIAWATAAARQRLMKTIYENLKAFTTGRPINDVTQVN